MNDGFVSVLAPKVNGAGSGLVSAGLEKPWNPVKGLVVSFDPKLNGAGLSFFSALKLKVGFGSAGVLVLPFPKLKSVFGEDFAPNVKGEPVSLGTDLLASGTT